MGECRGTDCPLPGFFMKRLSASGKRNLLGIVLGILLTFGLVFISLQPCLFVESESGLLKWFFISTDQKTVSLRFIHSVERTPVLEKYKVNGQHKLVLYETEYESFGVGLPFLASEGRFHAKDGRFVMEMDRVFPSVSLRTGPEAQLTLTVNSQQYPLYQMLPSGALVRLSAGTWPRRISSSFTTIN